MFSRLNGNPPVESILDFFAALRERPVAPLRHALGCEEEIRRRCLVNQEPAYRVADSIGLEATQVIGAVKLFESGTYSPERLACVVMLDWGLDNEDIAEIFGRSVRWAQVVRSQADEIRQEQPIPDGLEWIDSGLQPDDPSPAEIARRAKEVRDQRPQFPRVGSYRPGVRLFSRSGTGASFIQNRIA